MTSFTAELGPCSVRKFLLGQKAKDAAKFEEFHRDFGLYLKEAIISSPDQTEKEDIASLLLYESSDSRRGVKVGSSCVGFSSGWGAGAWV